MRETIRKKNTYLWKEIHARNFVLCIVMFLLFVPLFGTIASAQTNQDLAQQYAPILYFEKDETCFPADVSYHIDNSYLYQIGIDQPIDTSPSKISISENTSNQYYLDNQKGSVNDDYIINDYRSKMNNLGYKVYAHVISNGDTTIVQYWFFYAFNKGELNQHEGDWEMVQVIVSGGTPTQATYSQHYSGQKASWDQVEKDGNHIKVYVARGSHANYLRSYSGKLGAANDIVSADGKIIRPNNYNLELLENQTWLDFAGRWGWNGGDEAEATEAGLLGQTGPFGPQFRQGGNMWNSPLVWSTSLFQVNDVLFLLEWILYNLVTLFIIITLAFIAYMVFRIYRRHKKTGLGPRIVSILYIDSLNLKSIGNIMCFVAIIIAFFGLFNPWYGISIDVNIPDYRTTGLIDLLSIDGINGIQITLPDTSGPIPLGTFSVPFSFFIAVGIIFLVIASIGLEKSKKLGKKFLGRGISLLIPFVIILIVIMALALLVPLISPVNVSGNFDVDAAVGAVSGSPLGGEKTIPLSDVNGQIYLQWGLGSGLFLLVYAGIILIIAGLMEIAANISFFESKTAEKSIEEMQDESKKSGRIFVR
ncbi:MAG: Vps62-related protein [Thermoplasmatales archaeon]|nr:MAG: Vps62-related protein [Thermoplasmatales archaeon]